MMNNAQLTQGAKKKLWAEAVNCSNKLEDIVLNPQKGAILYKKFTGRKSKLYEHLIEFGHIEFVTIKKEFHQNWTNRSFKAIMTRYAKSHSAKTYSLHNLLTEAIIMSRNVTWGNWSRLSVTRNIDLFRNGDNGEQEIREIEKIDEFGGNLRVPRQRLVQHVINPLGPII